MTTAYSTNLELALPVQGELSGTWGDTVNNGITQYLDAAIAGSQIISGSQTAVTLTNTNGDSAATNIAQAGSGATGTAQYQIIRCTGNPAGLLTITISDTGVAGYSKTFVIINATSTSQSVKIVGSGPTTGITIASGDKSLVAWNGSDFVRVGASAGGSDTQVQFNSSGNLAGSANMTFDGTKLTVGNILDSGLTASKPVFTDASKNLVSTGTLGVDQGGTNLTAGTSGGVLAYTASGTLASSGVLAQYGVVLGGGAGAVPTSTAVGTATHVLTSNGAGVAPTFQALPAAGVTTFTAGTTGFTPNTATSGAVTLAGTLNVANGGTGLFTTTAYSVVFTGTTATGNFQASAGPGTSGYVLTSNGAGALPTFQAAASSGATKGQAIVLSMIFG